MSTNKVCIAVCVEDAAANAELIRRCREVCAENNINAGLQSYASAAAVAEELKRDSYKKTLQILIAELTSGLEAIIGIRKTGFSGIIIAISDTQAVGDIETVFDAEVFNFVVQRENSAERFDAVLLGAVREAAKRRQKHIILTFGGETRTIPLGDILMFETQNRMIKVTYGEESFLFHSTLDSLEEHLGLEGFCRVQRSYLVSMERIRSYTKAAVTLDNGVRLEFGRVNKRQTLAQIEAWLAGSAPAAEVDK
jgi:DNA-binding LytR/AlgR family response regulator